MRMMLGVFTTELSMFITVMLNKALKETLKGHLVVIQCI